MVFMIAPQVPPKNINEDPNEYWLIKRAKKHPDWYTKEDVRYAKRVRKEIKAEEAQKSE